jgi:hypothetical protein
MSEFLPRVWAAFTSRFMGGTCILDPRVWQGEPITACAWIWVALSPPGPNGGLSRNAEGMGWTKQYALLLHSGDVFVAGTLPIPRVEPGRFLRGCRRLDWPGSQAGPSER